MQLRNLGAGLKTTMAEKAMEKVIARIDALEIDPEAVKRIDVDGGGHEPGFVYIILETRENVYYKVGRSNDPEGTRVCNLQTGNVRPLKFESIVKVTDMSDAETAAKKALKDYSVNYGGGTEWFRVEYNKKTAFLNEFHKAVRRYEDRESN